MTLRELAESYNGTITMSVFASAEDEKPALTFPSDIHAAIKDEIMDKEVADYKVENHILYSEIKVTLAADTPAEPDTEVTE